MTHYAESFADKASVHVLYHRIHLIEFLPPLGEIAYPEAFVDGFWLGLVGIRAADQGCGHDCSLMIDD